jgi:hypothetical protein
MVHDEMLMRREYEVCANGRVLNEGIWVQNDVNVMEVNYEERRTTGIWPKIYRFAGEIGKAQVGMWIFADQWGQVYCSVVLFLEDKGVRDIVDLLAVHPDRT